VHKVDIFGFSNVLGGAWYNQGLYIVLYRQKHYPSESESGHSLRIQTSITADTIACMPAFSDAATYCFSLLERIRRAIERASCLILEISLVLQVCDRITLA
jgi:hypothetical protein